jgi:hypothetical protein
MSRRINQFLTPLRDFEHALEWLATSVMVPRESRHGTRRVTPPSMRRIAPVV